MAGTLPTIFGACEAQYPVTKTISFLTDITTSRNGTEQRRMARPPLIHISLKYHSISRADMLAMVSFFNSNGGSASSGITMSLFGVNYTNLYFSEDQFLVQRDQLSYVFSFSLYQLLPLTTAYGTPMVNSTSAGWLPPLEIPYTLGYLFRVNKVVQPSGPKYSVGLYNGVFRNYQNFPFGIWEFKFPKAPVSDVLAIETAFISQRGRYLPFSMQDPETIIGTPGYYQNCRFDNDELVETFSEDGSVSTTFSIRTVGA